MVTPQQIAEFVRQVPPLPQTLQRALHALDEGDLVAAASIASADPALMVYLKQVVNSAAFGFRSQIKEDKQVFSALGVQRAKELLYAYMVTLIAPKKWGYFSMHPEDFRHFQVMFMGRWGKLVHQAGADEKFLAAAAIMSAGLVVADGIFADHASEVALIRESGDIDLNTILERVSHLRFSQLVIEITKKWEIEEDIANVVRFAFADQVCEADEMVCKLAKMMHLLLFYELSRPMMLDAGANAFISFHPEFVEDVMELFQEVVEIE